MEECIDLNKPSIQGVSQLRHIEIPIWQEQLFVNKVSLYIFCISPHIVEGWVDFSFFQLVLDFNASLPEDIVLINLSNELRFEHVRDVFGLTFDFVNLVLDSACKEGIQSIVDLLSLQDSFSLGVDNLNDEVNLFRLGD